MRASDLGSGRDGDAVEVGGCDDLYALEQAGKLDPLLADAV